MKTASVAGVRPKKATEFIGCSGFFYGLPPRSPRVLRTTQASGRRGCVGLGEWRIRAGKQPGVMSYCGGGYVERTHLLATQRQMITATSSEKLSSATFLSKERCS